MFMLYYVIGALASLLALILWAVKADEDTRGGQSNE